MVSTRSDVLITAAKESRIIGSLTNCVLAHDFDPPVADFWDFQSIGARLCRVHLRFQELASEKLNEIIGLGVETLVWIQRVLASFCSHAGKSFGNRTENPAANKGRPWRK